MRVDGNGTTLLESVFVHCAFTVTFIVAGLLRELTEKAVGRSRERRKRRSDFGEGGDLVRSLASDGDYLIWSKVSTIISQRANLAKGIVLE